MLTKQSLADKRIYENRNYCHSEIHDFSSVIVYVTRMNYDKQWEKKQVTMNSLLFVISTPLFI